MGTRQPAGTKGPSRAALAVSGLLVLVVLLFTLSRVGPAAPGEVLLLSGPAGSRYHDLAGRYAAYLQEHGLRAHAVETEGSADNLLRLAAADTAQVGFVQSAVDRELEDQEKLADLVSLGSLYFEPFFVFARADSGVADLTDLKGRRVARGRAGGGARAVARLLLDGIQLSDYVISAPYDELEPEAAAQSLLAGELDAAFFVGESHSAAISRLLEASAVRPLSIRRARAMAARFPSLGRLEVPEGGFDLARNIPAEDLTLIAPATNLVTRTSLHPAVVDLLLDAAGEMQRGSDPVARRDSFPSAKYVSLPLSPAAARYYEEGPSRLRRILPFRMATVVDRFAVVVVPVLTIVLSLLKLLPFLLEARFKIRTRGCYNQLVEVEKDAAESDDAAAIRARLDEIDRESLAMPVPRSCVTSFLELRQYLHDMRDRL